MPVLYLLPNLLGEADIATSFTPQLLEVVPRLKHLMVENEKNARAFLKKCGVMAPYDDINMYLLDKHTPASEKLRILKEIGNANAGLVSDAGCPAVADPGAQMVMVAQQAGWHVKPLVGPSSILLALMASGFNGQSFTFHGYLPVKPDQRAARLQELEEIAKETGYTQIFMETPYRNEPVLQDVVNRCEPDTWLSVACDLTLPGEMVITAKISNWKPEKVQIKNRPAVFCLWAEREKRPGRSKYGKKY